MVLVLLVIDLMQMTIALDVRINQYYLNGFILVSWQCFLLYCTGFICCTNILNGSKSTQEKFLLYFYMLTNITLMKIIFLKKKCDHSTCLCIFGDIVGHSFYFVVIRTQRFTEPCYMFCAADLRLVHNIFQSTNQICGNYSLLPGSSLPIVS